MPGLRPGETALVKRGEAAQSSKTRQRDRLRKCHRAGLRWQGRGVTAGRGAGLSAPRRLGEAVRRDWARWPEAERGCQRPFV